jgi:hypothetical protein
MVYPCCDDYTGLHPLGDVRNQSLHEIWHGAPAQRLREIMKKGQRLSLKLCRERDCGIDENRLEDLGGMREKLRRQVVGSLGADSRLLRYL